MAQGKRRHIEERALAVAIADACDSSSEAARMLDWPVSTICLYRKQAENDAEFEKLCKAKRSELGSKFFDLSSAAAQRLKEKIDRDEVDPRTLVTIMGVGFQRGDTALNLEQPREVVVHQARDEVSERLRATIARLEQALPAGEVVEAEFTVSEGE